MPIKYIGIETNYKRLIQIDLDLSNHCNQHLTGATIKNLYCF